MTVQEKIIDLFKVNNELTVKELVEKTGASKQMVHLVLTKLLQNDLVQKMGRTPKTIYRLKSIIASRVSESENLYLTDSENEYLDKNFILVTETGDLLKGSSAFEHWCAQRKLPVQKTMNEFITTKKKYAGYYDKHGIINGTEKLKTTKGYDKIHLDELFYLDFYAIERFGKTPLGTLLHYAKQGQNKYLMRIMMEEIKNKIHQFIKLHKADVIGFVPPTIKREVQIMKFIQTSLQVALPVLDIKKISGIIPVPQKSLSKLEERINNAENTFAVSGNHQYKHLILIDDAVGSGSTLNQIAGKVKNKKLAKKITGLAVVGSFKGFDVITDV